MTRNLLILSLLVAGSAGAACAETAPQADSVAVNVSGMTSSAAQSALSDAARRVCQAEEADPLSASTRCYDATLADALQTFHHLRRMAGTTASAAPRTGYLQR